MLFKIRTILQLKIIRETHIFPGKTIINVPTRKTIFGVFIHSTHNHVACSLREFVFAN